MDGVAYVVGGDGRILACGQRSWSRFARENGGGRIADPGSVIGRHLVDFIVGDEVIDAHRGYMERLLGGSLDAVTFGFRCDAPDLRRDLWMTIRPLESRAAPSALLYQSIVLNELPRPPMSLFDFEALRARTQDRSSKPIVRLCAYCARVALPTDATSEVNWMLPEEYYRGGGVSDVRISHGVCDRCHRLHVAPFLEEDA